MPDKLSGSSMLNKDQIGKMVVNSITACLVAGLMVLAKYLFFNGAVLVDPSNPVDPPNVPKATSLADLLPNNESRAALGNYLLAVSKVLKAQSNPDTTNKQVLKTTSQVVSMVNMGAAVLQETTDLTGLSAISVPIKERFEAAVGDDDRDLYEEIDGVKVIDILANTYASIGNEILGVK